jgi:hypothetical protein
MHSRESPLAYLSLLYFIKVCNLRVRWRSVPPPSINANLSIKLSDLSDPLVFDRSVQLNIFRISIPNRRIPAGYTTYFPGLFAQHREMANG